MATGDIHNNLRKLLRELKSVRYPSMSELDLRALSIGTPNAFLPILHHVFLDFSCELSQFFSDKDYDLYGKTDLRFIETVYRILRDEFHYKPPLTKDQFLIIGYAERKVIQLCEILKKCRQKHAELNPTSSKDKRTAGASKKGTRQGDKLTSNESKAVKFDYHPLPANTEMKSFKNNQDAVRAGGFSEPLVTRMVAADEDKENVNGNSHNTHAYNGVIRSNLVQQGGTDHTSHNLIDLAATQSGLHTLKTVRWDDSNLSNTVKASLPGTDLLQSSVFTTSSAFPGSYSMSQKSCATGIPAPVAMTTAPKPSADLMLTPMGKLRHESIPLSASHDYRSKGRDVSLIDLTDSGTVQQPTIVCHSLNMRDEAPAYQRTVRDIKYHDNISLRGPPTSDVADLLKQHLKESEEKFNSVLAQNNEMSARIVLLESRMKMLEEIVDKKTCSCSDQHPKSNNYTLPSRNSASSQAKFTYLNSDGMISETSFPRPTSHASHESPTSCRLFTDLDPETTELLSRYSDSNMKEGRGLDMERNVSNGQLSPVSEASEHDTSVSSESSPTRPQAYQARTSASPKAFPSNLMGSPPRSCSTTPMGSPSRIVGGPYTPDIHLTFADPTTKATVMNVHRRMKETREMLARTNQNYAAKFNHS